MISVRGRVTQGDDGSYRVALIAQSFVRHYQYIIKTNTEIEPLFANLQGWATSINHRLLQAASKPCTHNKDAHCFHLRIGVGVLWRNVCLHVVMQAKIYRINLSIPNRNWANLYCESSLQKLPMTSIALASCIKRRHRLHAVTSQVTCNAHYLTSRARCSASASLTCGAAWPEVLGLVAMETAVLCACGCWSHEAKYRN